MVLRPVVFFAAQALACLYAARRGGAPERWVAGLMAAAAITTGLLPGTPRQTYRSIEWGELWVDLAFLICLLILACRANRFWPIWVAACQLIAMTVHAVRAYDHSLLPSVYSVGTGFIAYPMIVLLVIGTSRHLARSRDGAERDWSPLRWR